MVLLLQVLQWRRLFHLVVVCMQLPFGGPISSPSCGSILKVPQISSFKGNCLHTVVPIPLIESAHNDAEDNEEDEQGEGTHQSISQRKKLTKKKIKKKEKEETERKTNQRGEREREREKGRERKRERLKPMTNGRVSCKYSDRDFFINGDLT
jgi:hypothetical protein